MSGNFICEFCGVLKKRVALKPPSFLKGDSNIESPCSDKSTFYPKKCAATAIITAATIMNTILLIAPVPFASL